MGFDPWVYTRDSLIKQLTLIELHGKDGSATDAGCSCIEEKHIVAVEGLAEEAVGFSKTEAEKQFYTNLANLARELRKKIDAEEWTLNNGHNCPPCPNCERKTYAHNH